MRLPLPFCIRQWGGWDSNPRPVDSKSGTLPLRRRATLGKSSGNEIKQTACILYLNNGDGRLFRCRFAVHGVECHRQLLSPTAASVFLLQIRRDLRFVANL